MVAVEHRGRKRRQRIIIENASSVRFGIGDRQDRAPTTLRAGARQDQEPLPTQLKV